MKKMTADEFNSEEQFILLSARRVLESGKKIAKRYPKGAIVKVSENDKIQLIASGQGKKVADLSGEEIEKIKAEAKAAEKVKKDAAATTDEITQLKAQNAALVAQNAALKKAK